MAGTNTIEWFTKHVPYLSAAMKISTMCDNCLKQQPTVIVLADVGVTMFEFCDSCYKELKQEYIKRGVKMTHCA